MLGRKQNFVGGGVPGFVEGVTWRERVLQLDPEPHGIELETNNFEATVCEDNGKRQFLCLVVEILCSHHAEIANRRST